jgi:hypothetical protein
LQISLVAEIQSLLGAEAIEDLDFEALETALRTRSLQIAARALEQRFNRDASDAASVAHYPCSCGQMARFVDRRSKCFQTVLGDLTLERAYYHCSECQSGFCPRDRVLGLDGSLSPGVVRMIGAVGATVSFEEGSALLKELAGLHVVTKQVERTAESLGAEVAEDELTDESRRYTRARGNASPPTPNPLRDPSSRWRGSAEPSASGRDLK